MYFGRGKSLPCGNLLTCAFKSMGLKFSLKFNDNIIDRIMGWSKEEYQ
jgi:hypothetical protein